ncbi:sulfurtransferase TusA family protein [Buchnera aphidicola]|uniref:Sulfurtransferase TusA n=1 Tax=Buchnera aphidicola subsp. Tuberolachnus salignus TaxID=98804 RepID=A0A170PC71_BUCTT|nr:sulfurtransferase TusA family protein [Buchnera aphidicola]CUR53263.1 Sulfurtransferase TusA [Buchnera aphidicola (Tuberolachnus salignus)]
MLKKKYQLNLKGYRCPNFLLTLRKKTRFVSSGQKIIILTNDISNQRDIITFCHFMNYTLLSYKIIKLSFQYILKKK